MKMRKEKWADIWGYYGYYQISNLGRVKSLKRIVKSGKRQKRLVRQRIMRPFMNTCGYICVILYKNHKQRCFRVARLVGKYFISNPFNKPEVNHKKGNKKDNRAWMLEWNTRSENRKHAWGMGLNKGNTRKAA